MSQVIERIRHSCEFLVDRLNYYVCSNSADLLVIPLKYNLFSEFEGTSLVTRGMDFFRSKQGGRRIFQVRAGGEGFFKP